MKYSLTLLLGALLGFGALSSTAEARTVVVVSSGSHHPHSRAHRVWVRSHWVSRHGHHYRVAGHWAWVR